MCSDACAASACHLMYPCHEHRGVYPTCTFLNAGSALGYVCLGLLVFTPGAYASTIAAGSYLGIDGFDYSMMPQMARTQ